jgi:hypothetical protein
MSLMGKRIRTTTAVLIAACLVGAAGGAWAVTAKLTASDLVKGCVKTKGGTLRIASKCKRGEKPISWHKNGPRGTQGSLGTTGSTGPQGVKGALADFDSLAGLPCQVGTPKVGSVQIARNPNTGVQSILCVPNDGTPLQSTAQLQPGMVDPTIAAPDLFAWVQPAVHDKLYLVGEFHRFLDPSADARTQAFNDNLVYEFHIARGPTSLADVVTYRITFHMAPATHVDPADLGAPPGGGKEPLFNLSLRKQTYTLQKIVGGTTTTIASNVEVAPPNIGPRTFTDIWTNLYPTGQASYNDTFATQFTHTNTDASRIWAGPRDEAEYADLGGLEDGLNFRAQGTAKDSLAGFNSLDIALEIPTSMFTGGGPPPTTPSNANTLGIWMSTSVPVQDVRGNTVRIQVARSGFPFFEKLLIGEQDKDAYASSTPQTDAADLASYILSPVLVRDAEAYGFYGATDPTPFKQNRVDLIDIMNIGPIPSPGAHTITSVGDVLRVDIGDDSSFPDGRPFPSSSSNAMPSDVPDLLYSLILTKLQSPVSDGVNHNDANYLTAFPFASLPWSYLTTSHGVTTP